MGKLLILLAAAALLILGACGSNVEESEGTPISAIEESVGTPVSAVEVSAATPISAAELADRIKSGSPPLVLDVRNSRGYAQDHIPGAINIPYRELPERLAELPVAKSDEIVVHCDKGQRAKVAEKTLHEAGYSNIRDLTGQWQGWQAAELPTE